MDSAATSASESPYPIQVNIKEFTRPRRRKQQQRKKKNLRSKTTALHVHHAFSYYDMNSTTFYKGSDDFFLLLILKVVSSEMPTSGDLKSGDCLFFTPLGISTTPPRKIVPAPNGNDLGHYMMCYMMYILSKFEC